MEPAKKSSPAQSSDKSGWTYASEGMQLAVTLLLFIGLGYWIDERKHTSPWFTLIGSLVGITVGLYGFLRRFFIKKP